MGVCFHEARGEKTSLSQEIRSRKYNAALCFCLFLYVLFKNRLGQIYCMKSASFLDSTAPEVMNGALALGSSGTHQWRHYQLQIGHFYAV